MNLTLKRIIIFANDVVLLTEFYRKMFDIKEGYIAADKKWAELKCGKVNIAFHYYPYSSSDFKNDFVKIVFYAKDVPKARERLIKKSAKMGRVIVFEDLYLCDGTDPEGNIFQISSRK